MTLKAGLLRSPKYTHEHCNLTVPRVALLKNKLPHNSALTKDYFAYLGDHL